MKNHNIRCSVAFAALFLSITTIAQTLPTEGEWSGTYTITGTEVVNLTGDITMSGNVIIKGGKLTINSNGAERKISNGVSGERNTAFFETTNNGTLTINGTEGKEIILDGGTVLEPNYNTDGFLIGYNGSTGITEPSIHFYNKALVTNYYGTITLEYTTIQNVYGKRDSQESNDGAAFRHFNGTSNLSNCKFTRCVAKIGPGIYLTHQSTGTVTISNCEISDCYALATSGYGGTVRSIGNSKAAMTLSNTSIHHNFTTVKGGGLLYNGAASGSKCELKKCKIYKNYAKEGGGGGIMGSGNITFTNYSPTEDPDDVTKVYDNYSGKSGGGIYLEMYGGGAAPSSVVTVNQTLSQYLEVYNNKAPVGGGISIEISDAKKPTLKEGSTYNVIVNGASIHENTATGDGGGLYYAKTYTGGTSYTYSTTFIAGQVTNNSSGNRGGGIYIYNSPLFDIQGGKINGNESAKEGAGVYANGKVQFTNGIIQNNSSSTDGGGLYIAGGDMTVQNGTINKNKATSNGGGVFVSSGSLAIQGGSITENGAKKNGGGAYVSNGNLTIKGGSVSENTADEGGGGGLYVSNGNLEVDGGTVDSNQANNGGGVSVTGGLLKLNGGTISSNSANSGAGIYVSGVGATANIIKGQLMSNEATTNGGGVYIDGSTFVMNGGSISNNSAVNGAGVWSNGTLTFSNGVIQMNKATGNGGGLMASVGNVTFSNGTLTSNEAKDGGGIYLSDGAEMQYNNGGLVCFNYASHRGGGVYLKASGDTGNPTYLNFVISGASDEELGLYSNTAEDASSNPEGAGDDILAEGTSTKVIVPDISAMKLDGYSAPGATLRWYEDYSDNDDRYHSDGTNINTSGDAARYRKERDALHAVYYIEDIATNSAYQTKYLALTMGFEFKALAIRRKGLCPGEQAIYDIVGPEVDMGDGTPSPYKQRVVIYGTEANWDAVSVDIKGLPAGEYTVSETSWTWYNQNSTGSITGPLTQKITETNGTLFSFINTHPEETDSNTPMHDEKFKSNSLQ